MAPKPVEPQRWVLQFALWNEVTQETDQNRPLSRDFSTGDEVQCEWDRLQFCSDECGIGTKQLWLGFRRGVLLRRIRGASSSRLPPPLPGAPYVFPLP